MAAPVATVTLNLTAIVDRATGRLAIIIRDGQQQRDTRYEVPLEHVLALRDVITDLADSRPNLFPSTNTRVVD